MSLRTLLVNILIIACLATCACADQKNGTLSFEWNGANKCKWEIRPLVYTVYIECKANTTVTKNLKPGHYVAQPAESWVCGKYFAPINFTIKEGETTTVTPKVGQVALYLGNYDNLMWYLTLCDGTKEEKCWLHGTNSSNTTTVYDLQPGSYKVHYEYGYPTKKSSDRIISVRNTELTEVSP